MGLGPALNRDQLAARDGEMGWGGGCRGMAAHGREIAWDLGLAGHRQPGEDPH